jgi:host factor-I protein
LRPVNLRPREASWFDGFKRNVSKFSIVTTTTGSGRLPTADNSKIHFNWTKADGSKTEKATEMADRAQNLQDTFLNHVRKQKTPLTIFLINGVKLQGIVTWFDNFCVLLRRDGHSQLVYKHAISTVMPGAPVQLFEPGEESANDQDSA